MKKIVLISLLALLIQSHCIAQIFDSTWANSFQTVLSNAVSSTPYRGASAALFVPGQGMWTGVSGNSSIGVPITADMRFGIASITKTYIAVIILKLQEQGVLSLDDHLYQWIPAYPNVDSNITIRQLLNHQSGIFNFTESSLYWDSVWSDTSRFWTPQEAMTMVDPPYFEAGHGFYYSNTNYLLAGMIIEAATGNTWVQSMHNFILDPLLLDSTFIATYESPNGPVAHEWVTNNTVEIVNSPMTSQYSLMAAPAGIFTTAAELVQFYNALYSGAIISDSSFQELTNFEPTTFYGLGLYTIQSGRTYIYN